MSKARCLHMHQAHACTHHSATAKLGWQHSPLSTRGCKGDAHAQASTPSSGPGCIKSGACTCIKPMHALITARQLNWQQHQLEAHGKACSTILCHNHSRPSACSGCQRCPTPALLQEAGCISRAAYGLTWHLSLCSPWQPGHSPSAPAAARQHAGACAQRHYVVDHCCCLRLALPPGAVSTFGPCRLLHCRRAPWREQRQRAAG